MSSGKTWQFDRLFTEKRAAVRSFFQRRLRADSRVDAPDLTQEVYSRLLKASQRHPIEDPEAYLFTVARHLLEEHAVAERRRSSNVELSDPAVTAALAVDVGLDRAMDQQALLAILRVGIKELSPPCRAAVVMAYADGLSYREIAERLGVSKPMVQKYIAQAIAYCRQRMLRKEGST
ncbi:RNA polymerase sigma factor [Steroidobacter sp.]|uniref:RNA polymerase sigma factor n=1 Tax=Steroidobacter sp. TaxID=1978227 RepID=UPI001A4F2C63|nr:sigma-70 family RNA polymerase sigma factor [Steroidobacter sp.]MBL8265609.1 sigma-70 family RNA polymerase sigma factor [Steroidobacter sp.]